MFTLMDSGLASLQLSTLSLKPNGRTQPILDLQIEELRDELLQLERADRADASHEVGSDKVKQ
jgi:hypothetical protein